MTSLSPPKSSPFFSPAFFLAWLLFVPPQTCSLEHLAEPVYSSILIFPSSSESEILTLSLFLFLAHLLRFFGYSRPYSYYRCLAPIAALSLYCLHSAAISRNLPPSAVVPKPSVLFKRKLASPSGTSGLCFKSLLRFFHSLFVLQMV